MPMVNKFAKKPKKARNETDMRELRQKAYQDRRWRKERDLFLHEHPVCEKCLEKGKVVPATDIHHKVSPFKNGEINWTLMLDYDNLMALCKECHGNEHASQQGHITPEEVLKQLEDLLDENKDDSDFE